MHKERVRKPEAILSSPNSSSQRVDLRKLLECADIAGAFENNSLCKIGEGGREEGQ